MTPIQSKEKNFDFVPEVKEELLNCITIIFDNIANVEAGAIVNETNPQLKHRLLFGVNGAIHMACEDQRDELIKRLKILYTSNSGDFAFGSVVWTPTYGPLGLNSKCNITFKSINFLIIDILHAVAPIIKKDTKVTRENKLQLKHCYTNALNEAVRFGIRSIVSNLFFIYLFYF